MHSSSSICPARYLLGLLALSLLAVPAAQAAVCRVASNGSASHSGASWAQAKTLQSALLNTGCKEVWVRAGTYVPTTGTDRNASFRLRPGVFVYGGFAGNETSRDARNPAANETILSGNIGNASIATDNSYHVVLLLSASTSVNDTYLDGFSIEGGYAEIGGDDDSQSGGGILCQGKSSGRASHPHLSQLMIRDNHASFGGGLYNASNYTGACTAQLTDVVFKANDADFHGGAMFTNGCANSECNAQLKRVRFENNSAGSDGGAMYNYGENARGACSPVLTDVSFVGNLAGDDGGAMVNDGYGGASSPTLTNVTFNGNAANGSGPYAGRGGAMYTDGEDGGDSEPQLRNVTFYGNLANYAGGAMYNDGSDTGHVHVDVRGATFFLNHAERFGATIYNNGSGGGYALVGITNSIVWGGVLGSSGVGAIIYNNAGSGFATGNFNHSIVQGGCLSGNICTIVIGTNPILDPLQNNGGFTQTMKPQSSGSAIDNGNSPCLASDQRGIPRAQGLGCDIGAVEVVTAPKQVSVAVTGSGTVSATASLAPLSGSVSQCSSSGGTCAATYPQLVLVALTATPAAGWHFNGWGGACSRSASSATAHVTTDQNRACNADFAADPQLPNLTSSIDDGEGYAAYGQLLHYVITLDNSGSGAATNVAVSFHFSAALDASNASLSCVASGGATCPPGDLPMNVASLPAGGGLSWSLNLPVSADSSASSVTVSTTVTGINDVSDSDVLVIFRNGFAGSD